MKFICLPNFRDSLVSGPKNTQIAQIGSMPAAKKTARRARPGKTAQGGGAQADPATQGRPILEALSCRGSA